MNKKKINLSLVIAPFLLLIMGGLIYFTTQKDSGKFDIRNRASTGGGEASMTLVTSERARYIGDKFTIDVMLNTGIDALTSLPRHMSAATFRLVLPYDTAPVIELVDADPNTDGLNIYTNADETLPSTVVPAVTPAVINPNYMGQQISKHVNTAQKQPAGKMFIDLAVASTSTTGYTTGSNSVKLATLTFIAKKAGSITFEHDNINSYITDKTSNLDILQTIAPITITVAADTGKPTATIVTGVAEGTTVRTPSVAFSWTGSDSPSRPTEVALKYQYQFDTTAISAADYATSITRVLTHGTHTFKVRAIDPSGNIGDWSALRTFTLDLKPIITAVSPDGGSTGSVVTITGTNFGATKKTVKFGLVAATATDITTWTDTLIVVKVPASATDTITVTSAAALTSNVFAFNVGTTLSLVVKLQGATADPTIKRTATLVVKRATAPVTDIETFTNKQLVWSATDNAYIVTATFANDIPTAANYTVSIKEQSRLRKKYAGITLTTAKDNKIIKTAATDLLLLGDLNDSQDNKLTILDFGALMTKFTNPSLAITAGLQKFDLNGDNVLNILDIGSLLGAYTALEKNGDIE